MEGLFLDETSLDPLVSDGNSFDSPYILQRDADGNTLLSLADYETLLNKCHRKDPLQTACRILEIQIPKTANLNRLRAALVDHWFSEANQASTTPQTVGGVSVSVQDTAISSIEHATSLDDAALAAEFDTEGAEIEELLGFDDAEDGDEGGFEQEMEVEDFEAFQTQTRVNETRRAEGNRRDGGIRTQRQVVRQWEKWVFPAIQRGELKDNIVDTHHLLRWIIYCAERPKLTPQGIEKPNTRLGAAHIKKLFFGVLRIRKEQEASDPSLISSRPATSIVVWDALKSRMRESLHMAYNGLIEGEDAPDVVANTMLDGITEEQVDQIGMGFLKHSHLHSVINGHLAWTSQNGSGNRGDDLRALKLCELQPYTFRHPSTNVLIEGMVSVQSEDKTGGRHMKTKINPSYSTWMAHVQPDRCPLGAFAFYFHYIHDKNELLKRMEINWELNKSWRAVRVLHGPGSATTPYNEQNLYMLYVKAYAQAGFAARLKAHLPRHLLGYRQERLGVNKMDTMKMGWKSGGTYFDVYAPAIPKPAVLGAHGFMMHEISDPPWRHIHVPEAFLKLVCPMAEEIHSLVVGKLNKKGVTSYWELVISLRPYLFLCGAAIYEKCPQSALFRLPAFTNPSVIHWMETQFRSELVALNAAAGSPVDLERIQDAVMRQSLEQLRSAIVESSTHIRALSVKVERRTAILSPTKSFSSEVYQHRLLQAASTTPVPQPDFHRHEPFHPDPTPDSNIDPQLFDNSEAPHAVMLAPNLILPPALAFCEPGNPYPLWPLELGQRDVPWDHIYSLIKQPKFLWESWKPRALDAYPSVEAQWIAYNTGEIVEATTPGEASGRKPPLRQVEQFFKARWRDTKSAAAKKSWQRFIEVPQYIEAEALERGLSPQDIITELEDLRAMGDGGAKLSMNGLMNKVKQLREQKVLQRKAERPSSTTEEPVKDRKRKPPVEIRRHPAAKRKKD